MMTTSEPQKPFLSMDHITVRYLDKTIFTDLSFHIREGEQWAVVGPSGSGKTSLLNTISGKYNIINGAVRYHFYEAFIGQHPVNNPLFNYRHLIALVSHQHYFLTRSHTTDFYYQQRFNTYDAADAPTVKDYLSETLAETNDRLAGSRNIFTLEKLVDWLRLGPLMDRELIKLSNGETRRLMIAAALLQQPALLMLDSPFAGLDVQTRPLFSKMIEDIIAAGITVLLVTTPEEIPSNITHVAELQRGRLIPHERSSFKGLLSGEINKEGKHFLVDRHLLQALNDHPSNEVSTFTTAVKMEEVNVQYDHIPILQDINWTVERGEKWALLGPNGAGKSTLLSLINGDNPQAYANRIFLFDRRRGSGESIWDIKHRTGYVSPELHQYFSSGETCYNVVLSGFFDTIGLFRKCSDEQKSIASSWMELLQLTSLKDKSLKTLSAGEQRLVLLVRALVKNPPLLILDEPCQGLDETQKAAFKNIVEQVCSNAGKTLIYVTHYAEEIPGCVTKVLRLDKGRIGTGG